MYKRGLNSSMIRFFKKYGWLNVFLANQYILLQAFFLNIKHKPSKWEYVYHKCKEKWQALKKCRMTEVFHDGPDRRVGKVVSRLSRKDMTLSAGSAKKRTNLSNSCTRNAPSSGNNEWKYKETRLVQKTGQYNQFSGWRNLRTYWRLFRRTSPKRRWREHKDEQHCYCCM